MRNLLTICLLFASFLLQAQLYDAQWAMNYNESVLDFRNNDSVGIYSIPTLQYGDATAASICDENGTLLYYTNGVAVCGVNNILPGGWGLSPCAYTDANDSIGLDLTQAALFIPKPGSTKDYYLFHFSADALSGTRPGTMYYSIIDKEAGGGQGGVVQKNIVIMHGLVLRGGGMTACKHANGRDYWLIMGGSNNNEFYKFLITPDSVLGPYTQFIGPDFPLPYDIAYSKFSQDGSKYATGIFSGAPLLVMDFDRCSGEFSNPVTINHSTNIFTANDSLLGCYALEFSPNGRFLYVSNPHNLVQYDLSSGNIDDSIQLFLANDTADFYSMYMLQVAPNGKLYASTWNGGLEAIHVVNHPDVKGDSAGFVYAGQPTFSIASVALPNLANYKLGPLVGSGCDTIKTGITPVTDNKQPRILPNPANKYVYVEMGMQGNYEFDLLDINGQLLDTRTTPQVDYFDTEHLSAGNYFLKVLDKSTGNEIGTKKVIVIH